VLERIGTAAALALLDHWAQGDANARLTRMARLAAGRVRQRLGETSQ
jgi:hypothetical protein